MDYNSQVENVSKDIENDLGAAQRRSRKHQYYIDSELEHSEMDISTQNELTVAGSEVS